MLNFNVDNLLPDFKKFVETVVQYGGKITLNFYVNDNLIELQHIIEIQKSKHMTFSKRSKPVCIHAYDANDNILALFDFIGVKPFLHIWDDLNAKQKDKSLYDIPWFAYLREQAQIIANEQNETSK